MKSIVVTSLMLAFASLASMAFEVTGTVLNEKDKPQKNIEIRIKNVPGVTKTDKQGRFTLNAVDTDTLVVAISKTEELILPLSEAADITIKKAQGGAFVTTAAGTEKVAYLDKPKAPRRKAGVIYRDQIEARNALDLYDVLKIGLPGVTVSNGQVLIRGISSFKMGVEPLFIVDGAEFYSSSQANSATQVKEIETVEVDREGTSYGVKGANGVIIITYRSKVAP